MAVRRPRVLLADDHPLLLAGVRHLLEPRFEVIGAVSDGQALLAAAAADPPDLVVSEIAMPRVDGIEATRRLREVAPDARVLILSFLSEPCWVEAAFAAGARAYLAKTDAPEELELAIQEVLQGRSYVSSTVAPPGPRPESALTCRERTILHLVGRGLCNKEIAGELAISVTTVRTHLRRVYEKLGLTSRVQLALLAAKRVYGYVESNSGP